MSTNKIKLLEQSDAETSLPDLISEHHHLGGPEELTNNFFTDDLSGWTVGANWAWEAGGRARHAAGSTSELSQDGTLLEGEYYLISIIVGGRTAGSVTIALDGGGSFSVSGNGTTSAVQTWSNDLGKIVRIQPTSDFDGYIDYISITQHYYLHDVEPGGTIYGRLYGNWAALGDAAQKNVGTSSTQVAAGDRGVTNGDTHDHTGGDGAQVDHGSLAGLGDDDHPQYQPKLLLTTLGDIIYATASSVWARLAGNTTTTRKFLRQVGNGSVSAAPAWDTVTPNDVLVYNATTITTGNVSAAANNFYDCTIAGLTANRDFNLPTPAAAGEEIALRIRDGDNAFALIVKANSVEITRLFIAGEYLKFKSYGTGAGDWQIEVDKRKACLASTSREAAQSINDSVTTKVLLDSAAVNVGDLADITTNNRIDIRRAGNYSITGFTSIVNLDDQESLTARIYKNGSQNFFNQVFISSGTANQTGRCPVGPRILSLVAGDYIELYVSHNEGAAQNMSTTYLVVEEKL